MRARFLSAIAAAAVLAGFAGTAHAGRNVVVNGQRMNYAQIAYLERLTCRRIPNGAYWLHPRTGVWGYANSARPMGHISDGCRRAGRQRRRSLSKRGLLYTPGDLNFR